MFLVYHPAKNRTSDIYLSVSGKLDSHVNQLFRDREHGPGKCHRRSMRSTKHHTSNDKPSLKNVIFHISPVYSILISIVLVG